MEQRPGEVGDVLLAGLGRVAAPATGFRYGVRGRGRAAEEAQRGGTAARGAMGERTTGPGRSSPGSGPG
ncbi:hypothetical protein [Thermobispora bispora]|nr:hypothetical protein CYL17_07630 [Thermobispora bispora]